MLEPCKWKGGGTMLCDIYAMSHTHSRRVFVRAPSVVVNLIESIAIVHETVITCMPCDSKVLSLFPIFLYPRHLYSFFLFLLSFSSPTFASFLFLSPFSHFHSFFLPHIHTHTHKHPLTHTRQHIHPPRTTQAQDIYTGTTAHATNTHAEGIHVSWHP